MSISNLAFEALEMTYPNYRSEIYYGIEDGASWRRLEHIESEIVSEFLLSSIKYVVRRAPLAAFAFAVGEYPDPELNKVVPACAVVAGVDIDFDAFEAKYLDTLVEWLRVVGQYDGISSLLEGLRHCHCRETLLFFGRSCAMGNEIWSGFCGMQRA